MIQNAGWRLTLRRRWEWTADIELWQGLLLLVPSGDAGEYPRAVSADPAAEQVHGPGLLSASSLLALWSRRCMNRLVGCTCDTLVDDHRTTGKQHI